MTYTKLIKTTVPCILMMIWTSLYSMIDGFFVSNYVGKNAFAAINLIMPVLMGGGSLGLMIGSGGTALISFYLGRKRISAANKIFAMLVEVGLVIGIIIAIPTYFYLPEMVDALGASEAIRADTITYASIMLLAMPFFMISIAMTSFFVTVGKERLAALGSIISGWINIILDTLFLYILGWGIAWAAIASVAGIIGGVLFGLGFFIRDNDTPLKLKLTGWKPQPILKTCSNGISELLVNISVSLVSICYNFQLIKTAGENGIASYGVIMYVSFIFQAIFIGYSMVLNPLIGYNYGARNHQELKNILLKSINLIIPASIFMTLLCIVFAREISSIFVGYDEDLLELTSYGLRLYSVSYLFVGFNIATSAFFTGLNNGIVSGGISTFRTLIMEMGCVILLPIWFGMTGIWCAVTVAEIITLIVGAYFLFHYRKKYGYF